MKYLTTKTRTHRRMRTVAQHRREVLRGWVIITRTLAVEAAEEGVASQVGVVRVEVLEALQTSEKLVEAATDRRLPDVRVADVPLARHVSVVAYAHKSQWVMKIIALLQHGIIQQ